MIFSVLSVASCLPIRTGENGDNGDPGTTKRHPHGLINAKDDNILAKRSTRLVLIVEEWCAECKRVFNGKNE
jgi:hypothetical protein